MAKLWQEAQSAREGKVPPPMEFTHKSTFTQAPSRQLEATRSLPLDFVPQVVTTIQDEVSLGKDTKVRELISLDAFERPAQIDGGTFPLNPLPRACARRRSWACSRRGCVLTSPRSSG